MSLNFNQIENLLVKKKNESTLALIIIAYLTLKQKLEDTENHTWYFRQGIESKQGKMASLNNDFEGIRELFNGATLDFFIAEVNENNLRISRYNENDMNIIERMGRAMLRGNVAFYSELIRLKSKTELLMPINYYLDTPEEFLMIID